MFKKRAQAAMEFLMTYGWAILVVLVAIGALAYFGVLSPDKYLPERTTGPAGMDAVDKASLVSGAAGVGYIELAAKNNLGYDIIICDAATNIAPCTAKNVVYTGTNFGTPGDGDTPNGMEAATASNGAAPGTLADLATITSGATYNGGAAAAASGMLVKNGDFLKIKVFSSSATSAGRFKGDLTFYYVNAATGITHPATYTIAGVMS